MSARIDPPRWYSWSARLAYRYTRRATGKVPDSLCIVARRPNLSSSARSPGSGSSTGYTGSLLVSMASLSMMSAAIIANLASLSAERASGWPRQLRITPLTASACLAAKLIQAAAVVVPGLAVVSVCGVLVGHVSLDAAQWLGFGAACSFPPPPSRRRCEQ